MRQRLSSRRCPLALAGLTAAALGLLAAATPSAAVVAFTGTGQDFFDDAQASFPTVTPAVVGTALDLEALVDNEVLAVYPLAAAGTFGAADDVIALFQLGLTRRSDDFDPVFLLSDGTNVVGGQVGDNPNGSARAIEGTLAGAAVNVSNDPFLFDNAGFPAVDDSLEADIEVQLGGAGSDVRVAFLGSEATFPSTQVLDRTAELSFLIVANSAVGTGELYRLELANLEIAVPEPSPMAALGVGAAVLGAFGARRGGCRLQAPGPGR